LATKDVDDDDIDTPGGSKKLRNGLIIGLVLLLLLGGGAFAVWKFDIKLPFISSPTPTDTAPTAPSDTQTTPWQDGIKTRVFTMEEGQCFNFQGLADTNNQYAWAVDCTVPHDSEVFATGPVNDEEYPPNEDAWADWSNTICDVAFGAYVGVPWYQSDLDPYHLYPDKETWDSDPTMRQMICIARYPAGGLIESVRGSKR